MNLRHSLEIALPGVLIGAVAGAIAGGLTLLVGQPSGLVLAVPLAIFGGLYGTLLGKGFFRPGAFGPAGLYWMAAFPLARLIQELMTGLGMRDGVLLFLAYQALVSVGFAIGFIWMHERIMPYWLLRRAGDNPRAAALLDCYVQQARRISR
ncbi:hypothetical protein ACIBH1_06275 [Nonomuraea sp. NPDC050663]|uniref:hypothetical protein n=1 Tax=Nonomuraea sp. NPDC050663 TaxID=3364370 RepID=UPI0037938EC9